MIQLALAGFFIFCYIQINTVDDRIALRSFCFTAAVHDPFQAAVFTGHAVFCRVSRISVLKTFVAVSQSPGQIRRIDHSHSVVTGKFFEFFHSITKHTRQLFADIGIRIGIVVIAGFDAAVDRMQYDFHLLLLLLQLFFGFVKLCFHIFISLRAYLKRKVFCTLQFLIGMGKIDVDIAEITAQIAYDDRCPLMCLNEQLLILVGGKIMTPLGKIEALCQREDSPFFIQ